MIRIGYTSIHLYTYQLKEKSCLIWLVETVLMQTTTQIKGQLLPGLMRLKQWLLLQDKKYPTIDFTVGLAEQLPYKNESFDIVTSKYAIMTSSDMRPIFTEIYRVLKPGAYLFI